MAVGEFELIERCFAAASSGPGVLLGVGDDAAVLSTTSPLLAAHGAWRDAAGGAEPGSVASALLQAVTDSLTAAGARPRWLLLGLTLVKDDQPWIVTFAAALQHGAAAVGATIVGGDTTSGALAVDLFALGEAQAVDKRSVAKGPAGA